MFEQLGRGLRQLPLVRFLRARRHDRAFRNATWNCFQGVFPTFEAARAAIPPDVAPSYDNASSAAMYEERTSHVYEHDYPVLHWLEPLMSSARRVFDLGGHIGIARYSYERYLGPLDQISWTVCDVPAVAEAGRRFAAGRNQVGLQFTSRSEEVDGADILFASGSLQYIDAPQLPALLEACQAPPRHVLINMTPLTQKATYFTLNNIGTAICPYVIQNEPELLQAMDRLGYRVVDAWTNLAKHCTLPLTPEYSVDGYRGVYFRRS